jgi:glycerol-3-phosphate dehydrogenase
MASGMPEDWEVRGLFGNEYALENAVDELKKLEKVPRFNVLDRRNLQVVLPGGDAKTRSIVKNVITIAHGYVEADAPLGQYDASRAALKAKKLKEYEEKRRAALKSG